MTKNKKAIQSTALNSTTTQNKSVVQIVKNDTKSVNGLTLPPDFLNKPEIKMFDGTINKKRMALVMMIKNNYVS